LSEIVSGLFSWVPSFDGQTLFSLAVSLAVALATFYWGYRNTIGVREERIRTANGEVVASALRRLAVERERLTGEQFDAIVKTKSYRAAVSEVRMTSFDRILDAVTTDIIDNVFLDKNAKEEILSLVDESRLIPSTTVEFRADQKGDKKIEIGLALAGLAAGAASLVLVSSFWYPAPDKVPVATSSARDGYLIAILGTVGVVVMSAIFDFIRTVKRGQVSPPDVFGPIEINKPLPGRPQT